VERGGRWHDASRGPLRPGATLGRYQLLVPIGAGGMACVWAARLCGHAGFSKLVAIKTVLPHLNYRDFEDMLLDEARIVGGAHHPNVCDLLDVGKDQDVVYLVLEWVNGDSLLHLLRGTRRGSELLRGSSRMGALGSMPPTSSREATASRSESFIAT